MEYDKDSFARSGYYEVLPESKDCVAIDLGFSIDHAALVVMEKLKLPIPVEQGGVGVDLRQKLRDPIYVIRRIIEFPQRTPHAQVIEVARPANLTIRARDEMGQPVDKKIPKAERVVDVTGAQSFRELAKEKGFEFTPLTITAGGFDTQSRDPHDGSDRASKARLVSEVDAALATRDLILPDDIEGAQTLIDQLNAFRLKRSATTGAPTWGDTGGVHDDVLLATAYALRALRSTRGNAWNVSAFPFA